MKIRAGFVTNSSSFSSVNLTVTCAPLVAIINKYKKILPLDERAQEYLDALTQSGKFYYELESDGVMVEGRTKREFMTNLVAQILEFLKLRDHYYLNEQEAKKTTKILKPLAAEIQANLALILEETSEVRYSLKQFFYGENMVLRRAEFAELHPDKDFEDFFIGDYYSSFVYVNKGGKIKEKFSHDFEVGP